MLRDIAFCCYRHHWFSVDKVKLILQELVMDAYGDTVRARSRVERFLMGCSW
jgi:hypothetical protein